MSIFVIRSVRGCPAVFNNFYRPKGGFLEYLNPNYLNFLAPLGHLSSVGYPKTLNIL